MLLPPFRSTPRPAAGANDEPTIHHADDPFKALTSPRIRTPLNGSGDWERGRDTRLSLSDLVIVGATERRVSPFARNWEKHTSSPLVDAHNGPFKGGSGSEDRMLAKMNYTFRAVVEHVIVSRLGVRTSMPNNWGNQP